MTPICVSCQRRNTQHPRYNLCRPCFIKRAERAEEERQRYVNQRRAKVREVENAHANRDGRS